MNQLKLVDFVTNQQNYESNHKEKLQETEEMKKQKEKIIETSYAKRSFNCFCSHPHTTKVQINKYKSMNQHVFNSLLQSKTKTTSSTISIIPLLQLFSYLQAIELNEMNATDVVETVNDYPNIIMEYIEKVKILKKRFLKQISFRTTKQQTSRNMQHFPKLGKEFDKKLNEHLWRCQYEYKDNIYSFTFSNVDKTTMNKILEAQRQQQVLEERKAKEERKTIRKQQREQMEEMIRQQEKEASIRQAKLDFIRRYNGLELAFNVTEKEIQETKAIYARQCKGLTNEEQQMYLWKALAVERKNDIPLLPYIVDSFMCDRLDYYMKKKKPLGFQYWVEEYLTLKALSKKKEHQDMLTSAAILFFNYQLMQCIMIALKDLQIILVKLHH